MKSITDSSKIIVSADYFFDHIKMHLSINRLIIFLMQKPTKKKMAKILGLNGKYLLKKLNQERFEWKKRSLFQTVLLRT